MKKSFLFIAIVIFCVTSAFSYVPSESVMKSHDTRTVKMCGFSSPMAGIAHMSTTVLINHDEHVTDVFADYNPQTNDYCVSIVISCIF